MKWYVRSEDGDIWGPMSKREAMDMRDQLDDACIFNERIFSPQFVTSVEVKELLGDLKRFFRDLTGISNPPHQLEKRIKDTIVLLSCEKEITGTIEGGVLSLDPLPAGVTVEIKDYDCEGVDKDITGEDSKGSHFQAG